MPVRGTRGRGGLESTRGSRARGSDRGRGIGRGSRGSATTNGPRDSQFTQHPPEQSGEGAPDGLSTSLTSENKGSWDNAGDTMENSWDQANQPSARSPDASSWEIVAPGEEILPANAEPAKPSSKPDGTRSWASMFKKPDPPVARPKAAPAPALPVEEPIAEPEITPKADPAVEEEEPGLPPPLVTPDPVVETPASPPSSSDAPSSDPAIEITPSKDALTETNVEQLPDVSNHAPTATAASTVATTHDPHSMVGTGSATPVHSTQQQRGALRPGLGGFATSAQKATSGVGRSSSFQRRVLEQQEAVVMPSNHALDRTAVQFGSMGLNAGQEDLDVDEEREDAETRTQPPQHSPVAPRATLPPAPPQQQQQQQQQQQPSIDSYSATKSAPGLPPAVQQLPPPAEAEQPAPQSTTPAAPAYNQFSGRYGSSVTQPDVPTPVQKAYEPFGQQIQQHAQPSQYDSYPGQSQTHPTSQAPQPQPGAYSSSANNYNSNNADYQRSMYQNYSAYYQQPVHQATQPNTQDPSVSQQPRSESTYGTSAADPAPQYATSQSQQQPSQYRYAQANDTQASGNNTPNPLLSGHQTHAQGQQSHHMPQPHAPGPVGGQHGGYPYGQPYYNNPYYGNYSQVSHHHQYGRERPMFDDVRRSEEQYLTYNNQYGYGAGQGGYGGAPYGSKQGMYGQPHQYGMSPQTSYEQHSQSPANTGGYGQQSMPGRDNIGSLGGYGRSGSTNPTDSQTAHANNSGTFGSMPDMFNRTQQSSFSGANQSAGQQQGAPGGNDDASRSYGDSSKATGGPSPAPGQAGGRPGSATNNMQGQSSGMPSQHTGQPGPQAYGGYPNHMNHQMHGQQGSHYGAGPGAPHQSGGQTHQAYAGYGGGFGGSYYGNNARGGWGANYGH